MLRVSTKAALALVAFAFVAALFLSAPLTTGHAAPPPAAIVFQSAPDFTISVTPTFANRKRGSGEPYDIQVTAVNGFNGTVNFTVTGLFPGASIPIPPPPVTGSGQSSFDIITQHPPITPIGTFILTITGTSGNISHSQQVTLQMR
jgi:hypothetical protein